MLMADLFKELQEMMLNREKEHLATLIPYYETLWQHRDKIQDLLDTIDNYPEISLQYKYDEEEYYTEGTIEIFLHKEENDWHSQPNFHYEIELLHDERYWGYCTCEEGDKGYVPEKTCCGDGCDWVAPGVRVTKVDHIAYESFDGVESDMWELENKWKEDLSEHNRKLKKEQLHRLEEKLERTKMEIESIRDSL